MILEKVVALCEAKGITLYRLENDLNFANGTIRKWDEANPRVDKLKAVADYFGVTIDELLREDTNDDRPTD